MRSTRIRVLALLALQAGLCACAGAGTASIRADRANLTPRSYSYQDLIQLPRPRGKIIAAVYGFRDQTGQYRSAPNSGFSTAVTQGATSILINALKDSNWFVPVERENLQNLLTERRILRSSEATGEAASASGAGTALAPLLPASISLEGGIIAYESNIKTGGGGARYLGIGPSTRYRTDQVTISLRAIDVRSGRILNSVSTTKAIYSHQMDMGMFRFVRFKELMEMEAGFTRNEPAQLCVTEAIEAAVVHLIVQGVNDRSWLLADEADANHPVLRRYLALAGRAPAQASPAESDALAQDPNVRTEDELGG